MLILILDPLGNVPGFMAVLSTVDEKRRNKVLIREMLIALGILIVFLFSGPGLLKLFAISEPSLSIAGGVVLFLIALRMIFPPEEGAFGNNPDGEPFIVPLAVPFLAGPSTMAILFLLISREPERWPEWLIALLVSFGISAAIILAGSKLSKFLGEKGMVAIERLMGMLLTTLAVEMLLVGINSFIKAQG